jgi:hypothetical protein
MKIDGHELLITPSSFSDAMALQRAVASALKRTKIDLDGLSGDVLPEKTEGGFDLEKLDLSKLSGVVDTIAGLVLNLVTSEQLETCLFKCAERAVFGTTRLKVDREFFEEVENRKYFYPIMVEVIKVNVGPFFNLAGSMFSGLMGKITSSLK